MYFRLSPATCMLCLMIFLSLNIERVTIQISRLMISKRSVVFNYTNHKHNLKDVFSSFMPIVICLAGKQCP